MIAHSPARVPPVRGPRFPSDSGRFGPRDWCEQPAPEANAFSPVAVMLSLGCRIWLLTLLLSFFVTLPVRADEPAARALARVRDAYSTAPVYERLTIEVRSQTGGTEASEGSLAIDLAADAPHPLDLSLGPIRAFVAGDRLNILHATDPDRYVGLHLEPFTFAALSRGLPALPLPQLAIALPDPDSTLADDEFALAPLLPPVTLREVARGATTITLAGRSGPAAVTFIINAHTHRLERFEATIPAPSGWYELILTCTPIEMDPPPGAQWMVLPEWPDAPDLSARTRVDRVADLRPRGLVLVPGADLAWIPVTAGPADNLVRTTLGDAITPPSGDLPAGTILLGIVELTSDESWVESARAVVNLMHAVSPDGLSYLLVFDPRGRQSLTWPSAHDTLVDPSHGSMLGTTEVIWVDGRTLPLNRSLPRLDPAVLVITPAGVIVEAVTVPAEGVSAESVADRLRASLRPAP